jgi:tripartite-type tricarboxylate transporter receptor subunit TctC
MFDTLVGSLPHIRSGTIRALAVAGSSRLDVLPDAPRVADTVPGFEVSGWNGFAVRKGVPAGIIERLNTEISTGLADPIVKARIAQATAVPLLLSPAQFGAHMAAETEKWGKVIRTANIKAD